MRFNDRELVQVSSRDAELEGILSHKPPKNSGNFTHSGSKDRFFKLKGNILFYFRISDVGKIDNKEPAGLLLLENANVQIEVGTELPFAFSMIYRDEPDKKHIFSGRTESVVFQWVAALRQASYEHWRSQLVLLRTKISSKSGIDPLLSIPHNHGIVRDIQSSSPRTSPRTIAKFVGSKTANFKSHLGNFQTTPSTLPEKNLIEF